MHNNKQAQNVTTLLWDSPALTMMVCGVIQMQVNAVLQRVWSWKHLKTFVPDTKITMCQIWSTMSTDLFVFLHLEHYITFGAMGRVLKANLSYMQAKTGDSPGGSLQLIVEFHVSIWELVSCLRVPLQCCEGFLAPSHAIGTKFCVWLQPRTLYFTATPFLLTWDCFFLKFFLIF